MKKRLPGLVALMLLLAFAAAVAYINWNSRTGGLYPLMEEEALITWASQSSEEALKQKETMLAPSSMRQIAQEQGLRLLFSDDTCEWVLQTDTGREYRSNPKGRLAFSKSAAAHTASQIVVSVINRDEVASSYYSFDHAVQYGQYRVTDLERGVRVEYMMGKLTKTPLYPQALTEERYEEIYAQLAAKDQRKFKTYYSIADFSTLTDATARETLLSTYENIQSLGKIYVFKSSPTSLIVKNNLSYFASIGYTWDDLEQDHALVGYQAPAAGSNNVYLPVEYTLENGAVQVKVCLEEMQITGDIKVESVYVLPYFEMSRPDAMEAVVTAGSGAIIPLTGSFSAATPVYQEQVYGVNFAEHAPLSTSQKPVTYLPLIGFTDGESACYAHAAAGAADMYVRIEPPTGSNAVAAAGFQFSLLEYASIRMDATSAQTVNSYADQAVLENCIVSYHPLAEGEADWLTIANAYRQHLIDAGTLTPRQDMTPGALFTLIGAVDDTTLFLGFPRESDLPLTTYQQASRILEEMHTALPGTALSFRLQGWAQGGVRSPAMASLAPSGTLGGKNELQSLIQLAEQRQIPLYPDADIQHVYRDTWLDGFSLANDASRNVISETAARTEFNAANFQRSSNAPWGLAVHPKALEKQGGAAVTLGQQLGLSGLCLPYAGQELNSDYSRNHFISRSDALPLMQKALETMSREQQLLIGGANLYTLPYAYQVSDVPTYSIPHPMAAYAVPFTQAVLAGCIPCGAEPFNTAPDFTDYLLRCIEAGAMPCGNLIYADGACLKGTAYAGLLNISYPALKEDLIRGIAMVQDALSQVYGQPMQSYRQAAPGVVEIYYANGFGLCINYQDAPYTLEDGRVIPAKGYLKIEKGGQQP